MTDILGGESSLGLTFATNLYTGREPDSPDNCVTLYDMAGSPPQLTYSQSTSNYYFSGLLVRVRNNNYQDAWDQAYLIHDFLHGYGGETWNGTVYTVVKALDNPQLFNWDENERAIVIINFEVQRKPS